MSFNRKMILSSAAAGLLPLLAVAAGDAAPVNGTAGNGWRMSLGVSYRSFKKADMQALSLRNGLNTDPTTNPIGLQGYENVTPSLAGYTGPITVDMATFTGAEGSLDAGSSFAPVVGLERALKSGNGYKLSLAANLQYHSISASESGGGNVATVNYNYFAVGGIINPAPLGGPNPGAGATAGSLSSKMDMDLFVIDLGLKIVADNPDKRLSWYAAAGPTLSIANTDASLTESAIWAPVPGTADPGSYSSTHHDSGIDMAVGAYGALGAEYKLNKNWSVGLEARYDAAFSKVGNDLAELDLNGPSVQLKLSYAF